MSRTRTRRATRTWRPSSRRSSTSPGQASQGAGVTTTTTSLNTLQGQVESTQTTTNLAVQGAGFFVVSDSSGNTFLTRNGSFVPDARAISVNSAGYYLMGATTQVGHGEQFGQFDLADCRRSTLTARPSGNRLDAASLTANLPSTATVIAAANLPSTNTAGSTIHGRDDDDGLRQSRRGSHDQSLFRQRGRRTWEVDAYDASTASAGGGFPYSSGPLATATLTFNPTTGALTSGSPLSIPIPGGQNGQPGSQQHDATRHLLRRDLGDHQRQRARHDVEHLHFAEGRDVVPVQQRRLVRRLHHTRSPMSPSPDNMTSALGDAYQTNTASGPIQINNADTGGLGTINSSSLGILDGGSGEGTDQHDRGAERLRSQLESLSDRGQHLRRPQQPESLIPIAPPRLRHDAVVHVRHNKFRVRIDRGAVRGDLEQHIQRQHARIRARDRKSDHDLLRRFRGRLDHAAGQQRPAGPAQRLDLGIGGADRDLDGAVHPGADRRRQRVGDLGQRRASRTANSPSAMLGQPAKRAGDLCGDAQQHGGGAGAC